MTKRSATRRLAAMRKLWVLLLVAISGIHCSTKTPEQFQDDKLLYEHALSLFNDHEFSDSIPFFESLRNRFPQSPYALDSELKIADAYFEQREWATAEASYQTFRTLHPTHEKIPYIIYQIGLTQFNRIPSSIDRDQTYTEKAIDSFHELSLSYPNAPQVQEAQKKMAECKRMLAERELYVANFYLRQSDYQAALLRLETVRANPDFGDLRSEATYKLGFAYYKLKDLEQAKKVLSALAGDTSAGKYQAEAKDLLAKIKSM